MRSHPIVSIVLLTASVISVGAGCKSQPQARDTWSTVIKNCVGSDVLGSKFSYFGPSNNVGPGAVWRERGDGGLALVWPVDIIAPKFPTGVVHRNPPMTCSGVAGSTFDGKVGASLITSAVKGISVDAQAALNNAKSINVSVDSVTIEQIAEGPYQAYIDANPNSAYVKDASKKANLVSSVAYKVSGFKASLTYSSGGAASAEAAFKPGGASSSIASIGANFNVKSTSNDTLEITSKDPFYIGAILGHYDASAGIGAGHSRISEIEGSKVKGLAYEPAQ
jgi:hypothetical protein